MTRLIVLACFLIVNFPLAVFAQNELNSIWVDPFFSVETPEKIALVSRSPEEIKKQTSDMERRIRDALYESGKFSVVKDGRDFPDNFNASKNLATRDLAFVCILDGYPAPDRARFELKCYRKTDLSFLSFLGTQDDLKSFVESKRFRNGRSSESGTSEKRTEDKRDLSDVGKGVVSKSQFIADETSSDKRLYLDPTRKNSRRILVGKNRIRVKQGEFYELIGQSQLKNTLFENEARRMTLFVAGSVAIAVGAGLIFGGVYSNAGCGNDEGCKSNLLPILGGTALGLGGISIATGFFLDHYPTSSKEDRDAIDLYNGEEKEGN